MRKVNDGHNGSQYVNRRSFLLLSCCLPAFGCASIRNRYLEDLERLRTAPHRTERRAIE